MKKLFEEVKLIYKVDKRYLSKFLGMYLITAIAMVLIFIMTKDCVFLILPVFYPALLVFEYFRTYKPAIRSAQEEIRLKRKYSYLYNKIVNGGK